MSLPSLLKCCFCKHLLSDQALTHVCGYSACSLCYNERKEKDCCNQEGPWQPLSKAMKESLTQVSNTLVPCPYRGEGCKDKIKRAELSDHLDFLCKFSGECSRCGEMMPRHNIDNHWVNYCRKRLVQCTYCERTIPAYEQEDHEKNLLICVKGLANLYEHPLVRKHYRMPDPKVAEDPEDDFIVPDDEPEPESKKKTEKQWEEWRQKKKLKK